MCILCSLLGRLAHATAPVSLSLADAVRLAHEHSPTVVAAGARVAEAGARLRAAGLPPNPSLAIAHGTGHDAAGLDEDVILGQTLELPGKTGPRVRSARSERAAAIVGQVDAGRDLDFSVRSAYYETLRAEADRQLAANALFSAKTFEAAAQTQFTAGDAPKSNVVRSQIETARAQQALDAAEAERDNRYAALRSLTGLPPDTPVTLTDQLAERSAVYDLTTLQEQALRRRADLLAARHLRRARQADVTGAQAEWQPDLFVEVRKAAILPYTGASNGYSVRAGITLPLFDLGRNRADVTAAKAALTEQQAALDETTRRALLDVETAYNNYMAAQKAVASFRTGRLDRAKELLDMAQTGYEHGASSYLELLDAQQAYRSEQTDYTRSLADEDIALAALERVVGGTLPAGSESAVKGTLP